MRRKDYEALADILRRYVSDRSLRALLTVEISDYCKKENPRFNVDTFIKRVHLED